MLRSVKYGLYGAVLAGLVGGSVAWSNVDKTVRLVVDGQSRTVQTTASRVDEVLAAAGYHLAAHDLVAPSPTATVSNGATIVYEHGRMLRLNVNGTTKDVWTTAPTVAEAMAQLGYTMTDYISVSRSWRLPLSPTDITVRTPKLVTLVHDGQNQLVMTTAGTVGQLLQQIGFTVDPGDRLSLPMTADITPGVRIVIARMTKAMITKTVPVPFSTATQSDPSLAAGQSQIITPGADGVAQVTYALIYLDGKLLGETRLRSTMVSPPTTQVEAVGTGPSASSNYSSSGGSSAPVSPGSAQAIAQSLVQARGWGSDQFSCLVQMWDHESGWRVDAANPSGAYGIPQALPGSKMAAYGSDWQTNPRTQIEWGLAYISSRYGTPCGAWSSWQANGGWY